MIGEWTFAPTHTRTSENFGLDFETFAGYSTCSRILVFHQGNTTKHLQSQENLDQPPPAQVIEDVEVDECTEVNWFKTKPDHSYSVRDKPRLAHREKHENKAELPYPLRGDHEYVRGGAGGTGGREPGGTIVTTHTIVSATRGVCVCVCVCLGGVCVCASECPRARGGVSPQSRHTPVSARMCVFACVYARRQPKWEVRWITTHTTEMCACVRISRNRTCSSVCVQCAETYKSQMFSLRRRRRPN